MSDQRCAELSATLSTLLSSAPSWGTYATARALGRQLERVEIDEPDAAATLARALCAALPAGGPAEIVVRGIKGSGRWARRVAVLEGQPHAAGGPDPAAAIAGETVRLLGAVRQLIEGLGAAYRDALGELREGQAQTLAALRGALEARAAAEVAAATADSERPTVAGQALALLGDEGPGGELARDALGAALLGVGEVAAKLVRK